MKNPSVYFVVLNWNGLDMLKKCIPSLLKTDYNNYKIILVDNGSADGSVDYAKKHFDLSNIEIIELDKNYGYSPGMNRGIEHAIRKKADFISLVSNDIIVDSRWIRESLKVFRDDSNIGAVGFDLLEMEKEGDIKEFRKESKKRKKFSYEIKDFVLDAIIIVRGSLFKAVGGFDEKYISYGEEEDLYQRFKLAGFKLAELNLPIYHKGHGTSSKIPIKTGYLMMRNSLRYSVKWLGAWETFKRFIYILHVSSNPFANVDKSNLVKRKLRPSNVFINFFLFSGAVFWNIFNIFQTLSIKNKQVKKSNKAKKLLLK